MREPRLRQMCYAWADHETRELVTLLFGLPLLLGDVLAILDVGNVACQNLGHAADTEARGEHQHEEERIQGVLCSFLVE